MTSAAASGPLSLTCAQHWPLWVPEATTAFSLQKMEALKSSLYVVGSCAPVSVCFIHCSWLRTHCVAAPSPLRLTTQITVRINVL